MIDKHKEDVVHRLMEHGLAETLAIEAFVSRNEHDMQVVLDFLWHYGEYVNSN